MNGLSRQSHWEHVYATKGENEVSWFEEQPAISLDLIQARGVPLTSSIVDIGGGASRLVDALIAAGYEHVTVLDLSVAALSTARTRLGGKAAKVTWVVADVTAWEPHAAYDVWHDRAAFHFLTEPDDRAAYVACLTKALRPDGYAIIGTFAPDGPERCSGLPVMRYDADGLAKALGSAFKLAATRRHVHRTPAGATQSFQFSVFRRART